jgi:hypothetical protein
MFHYQQIGGRRQESAVYAVMGLIHDIETTK